MTDVSRERLFEEGEGHIHGGHNQKTHNFNFFLDSSAFSFIFFPQRGGGVPSALCGVFGTTFPCVSKQKFDSHCIRTAGGLKAGRGADGILHCIFKGIRRRLDCSFLPSLRF